MSTPTLPDGRITELYLRGSDYEIGCAHAEATGAGIRDGLLPMYLRLWERAFRNAEGTRERRWMRWTMEKALVGTLARRFPPVLRDRIRGVSDVSGTSLGALAVATALPDLLPILQGTFARLGVFSIAPPAAPLFGCSSFFSSGGKFLFGRNLDFPGVGYWERYPVLQTIAVPGKLRYAGFATAGVPVAGITGVNEARVAVALHQHYALGGNLGAPPPFAVAEEILGTATSLAKAREMALAAKIGSAWAFVLADGKTKEAVIVERTGRSGVCVPLGADGTLAHSNYFQAPPGGRDEYACNERMNWDNWSRKHRLHERIAAHGADLTVAQSAAALSEHFDPYWGEEKPTNRVVSQLYNLQSVVFDLDTLDAWAAEGPSPVHLRKYRRFRLSEAFEGRTARTEDTVPGYQFHNDEVRIAKQHYVDGFISGFDGAWEESIASVRRAQSHAYTAEGAYVEGQLFWKTGDAQRALASFAEGIASIEARRAHRRFPPEYYELRLAEAKTLDLLGRRGEAVAKYRALADDAELRDPTVKGVATRAKTFTWKDVKKIFTPFSSYTLQR